MASLAATSHAIGALRSFVLVESDGIGTTAHLVHARTGIRHSARSSGVGPHEDARRAIAALRDAVGRLPRRAVLVTDEACAAVLELPAALARRAPQEIHEALAWEMEGARAQRAGTRPIGGILLAQGLVVPGDIDRVLDRLAGDGERRRDAVAMFGETARQELGLSGDAILAALAAQRFCLAQDEGLDCAWTTPVRQRNDTSPYATFATVCLSSSRRETWREVLRSAGLRLTAILAHETAPLGLIPPAEIDRPGVLVHLGSSWATVVHVAAQGLTSLERHVPRRATFAPADVARWIEGVPEECVWIALREAGARPIAEAFRANSPATRAIGPGWDDGDGAASSAAQGAASVLCGHPARTRVALLGRGELRDPGRVRRAALSVGLVCLLAIALVAIQWTLERRVDRLAGRLAELSARRQELSAERDAALRHNERVSRARAALGPLEARVLSDEGVFHADRERLVAARRELDDRRTALPRFFDAVRNALVGPVQVLGVSSPHPGRVEFELLAGDTLTGQRVVAALASHLSVQGFSPGEAQVSHERFGRRSAVRLQATFSAIEEP